MTRVTCRPWPTGAEGIGLWQDVFANLSSVAVTMHLAVAVFVMNPMQMWPLQHQLVAFVVLEHAMLFLRGAVRASIPDEPDDVTRIRDLNAHLILKFEKLHSLKIPPEERCNITKNIDVGFR